MKVDGNLQPELLRPRREIKHTHILKLVAFLSIHAIHSQLTCVRVYIAKGTHGHTSTVSSSSSPLIPAMSSGQPASSSTKGPSKKSNTRKPPSAPKFKTQSKNTSAPAAPSAGKKSSRSRKKKKSSGDGDGSQQQRLKVVVRRLPPNLPQEIFWKSVEPYTGVQTLPDKKPQVQVKVDSTEDTQGQQPEGKEESPSTSSEPKKGPLITLGSPGQDKLLWRRYIQGKFKHPSTVYPSSSNNKDSSDAPPHTSSRAYLKFKTLSDLLVFHKNFDGHIFRDAKGNESVALVEWSSFQKVPPLVVNPKKVDKLQGTIDDDPEYLEFVNGLNKQEKEEDASNQEPLTTAIATAQKNTPLLDFLRNEKAAKQAAKLAAKQANAREKKAALNNNNKASASSSSSISTNTKKSSSASKVVEKGKGKSKSKPSSKKPTMASWDDPSSSSTTTTTAPSSPIPTGPKAQTMSRKEKAVAKQATKGSNNTTKGGGAKKEATEPAPAPVILKRNATDTSNSPAAPAPAASEGGKKQPEIPTGPRAQNSPRGGGGGAGRGASRGGGKKSQSSKSQPST
ncbi:unnamed protein product [Sympodiomycopsis kandeliae]